LREVDQPSLSGLTRLDKPTQDCVLGYISDVPTGLSSFWTQRVSQNYEIAQVDERGYKIAVVNERLAPVRNQVVQVSFPPLGCARKEPQIAPQLSPVRDGLKIAQDVVLGWLRKTSQSRQGRLKTLL
jgi:hypothetical protein